MAFLDGAFLVARRGDFAQIVRDIIRLEGISQGVVAKRLGTSQATVSRWENGSTPKEARWREGLMAWHASLHDVPPPQLTIDRAEEKSILRVMGTIGTGGVVMPPLAQVPPDGVMEIEIDMMVPAGSVAFAAEDATNYPRIDDGEIVVCKTVATTYEQPFGWWAIVQLKTGERFYRRVRPGWKPDTYYLEAVNAPPMLDVELAAVESIMKVEMVVQADSWREIDRDEKARFIRRQRKRDAHD